MGRRRARARAKGMRETGRSPMYGHGPADSRFAERDKPAGVYCTAQAMATRGPGPLSRLHLLQDAGPTHAVSAAVSAAGWRGAVAAAGAFGRRCAATTCLRSAADENGAKNLRNLPRRLNQQTKIAQKIGGRLRQPTPGAQSFRAPTSSTPTSSTPSMAFQLARDPRVRWLQGARQQRRGIDASTLRKGAAARVLRL